mmetsp:Transcript_41462/g.119513  ORF Transcript_41462/g.119513 Transcript_41462/m.119513 type:complete len:203 (-) Transcript_41462:2352-2960(-)
MIGRQPFRRRSCPPEQLRGEVVLSDRSVQRSELAKEVHRRLGRQLLHVKLAVSDRHLEIGLRVVAPGRCGLRASAAAAAAAAPADHGAGGDWAREALGASVGFRRKDGRCPRRRATSARRPRRGWRPGLEPGGVAARRGRTCVPLAIRGRQRHIQTLALGRDLAWPPQRLSHGLLGRCACIGLQLRGQDRLIEAPGLDIFAA